MDDNDSLAGQDVHFRVGNDPFDPREPKYRTVSIVFLIINFIAFLVNLAWFIQSVVSGNDIVLSLTNLIFSLLGLLILGNGIYGSSHRGCSLFTYTIIFEFFPAVVLSISIVACLLGFPAFKNRVQTAIIEQKLDISVGAAIAIILTYFVIVDVYHIFAGVMINRYRKICKQRDWEF